MQWPALVQFLLFSGHTRRVGFDCNPGSEPGMDNNSSKYQLSLIYNPGKSIVIIIPCATG